MNLFENLSLGAVLDMAQSVAVVLLWLRKPGQDATVKADAVAGRVSLLEERLKHMPTSDELTELEGTVRTMDARLSGVADSQETVRNTVVRIENYLLSHRT